MSNVQTIQFGALFDKAWAGVKNNLPLVAALSFVYSLAGFVMHFVPYFGNFLHTLLTPGYIICLLKLKDKQDITMLDFFWSFSDLNRLLNLIVLNFLTIAIAIAGLVAFIIPGIYLYVALGFGTTIFVLRRQDGIEAIKDSYKLVQGHWWQVATLFFFIGMLNLLGLICFVIGILVTIPMSMLIMIYAMESLETMANSTGAAHPPMEASGALPPVEPTAGSTQTQPTDSSKPSE